MVRIKNRYLLVEILSPSAPKRLSNVSLDVDQDSAASLLFSRPSTLQHHLPTPDSITAQVLVRLFRAQILQLFGDHGAGAAAAGLAIKYWSNATSTLILRCSRASVRMVWAAITFVKALVIGGDDSGARGRNGTNKGTSAGGREHTREVVMQVVRVSGTIKKCEEEAIRRARAICGKVKGLQVVTDGGIDLGGNHESHEEDEDMGILDQQLAMAEANMESGDEDSEEDT